MQQLPKPRSGRRVASFAVAMFALVPMLALAITWVRTKVQDPVSKAKIEVSQPASSGGYIYEWPEKSDQVFWPFTDDQWLWFSPKSGYIAFGGDFEEIAADDLGRVKAWLATHFDPKAPPKTRLERLAWAQQVYEARGMDDQFWVHFYRLMAFETRATPEASLGYVRKALPLLQQRHASTEEPWQRLESLYLLSEYHRRLGNASESQALLDTLRGAETDEKLGGYKAYLLNVADEQRAPVATPAPANAE